MSLKLENVTKTYGPVTALANATIEVHPGEVVGLVGENGAGKSTLMRILAGVVQPSSGAFTIDGEPVRFSGTLDANAAGIGMVYQEQSLILPLSIAENMYLGQERRFTKYGLIDHAAMREAARRNLEKVQLDIDPVRPASELTFAERQMVELAKALTLEERDVERLVILLDEPTSVLEQAEIDVLFARIRALKDRASFIFVSHRLDEVLEISDRIYTMKDGEVVDERPAAGARESDLHEVMVGRVLEHNFYLEDEQEPPQDSVALELRGLGSGRAYRNINLTLHAGEVLGIAGVIGSGREALARAVFGMERPESGEIVIHGKVEGIPDPSVAVRKGLGFVPSERGIEGMVPMLPVSENISLANLDSITGPFGLDRRRETALAREWIERLRIKTPGPAAPIRSLSGGNQQKAVIAKWLNADSRILVLDHPTRGVDVGAKHEVFSLIRELCREGYAILLLADTLAETIGLSHRVLVMRDGEITADIPAPAGDKPSQTRIVEHMV
ncbi:sugar ABC transporter ATP-binding protein [Tropicimonas isoalkanivorans]|uniref:Ribose transport system ATP-binding protein n=1 Tax=Tropicimonas isoalkanivorans TaxID=441112 RepID=A0A1I1MRA4_9RHOB|nr:sugar ABC transporter ATP-binding protein [Tropicimonas isoalkanivorans]SFC87646.1 ribose transport system ATP-binding protein [Tropicimonas isoalkanivorans]